LTENNLPECDSVTDFKQHIFPLLFIRAGDKVLSLMAT